MTSSDPAVAPIEGFPAEGSEQDQRVWVLDRAKEILYRGPFTRTPTPEMTDVVDLANYILTGEHPLARYGDDEDDAAEPDDAGDIV